MNEPIITPNEDQDSLEVDSEIIVDSHPSHFGLIIGLLIVILTMILIGLYVWSQMMVSAPVNPPITPERPTAEENNEPESTTAEAQTEVLEVVSTSDEISLIEADLEATDLDSLDTELNAIEAELDALVE